MPPIKVANPLEVQMALVIGVSKLICIVYAADLPL